MGREESFCRFMCHDLVPRKVLGTDLEGPKGKVLGTDLKVLGTDLEGRKVLGTDLEGGKLQEKWGSFFRSSQMGLGNTLIVFMGSLLVMGYETTLYSVSTS